MDSSVLWGRILSAKGVKPSYQNSLWEMLLMNSSHSCLYSSSLTQLHQCLLQEHREFPGSPSSSTYMWEIQRRRRKVWAWSNGLPVSSCLSSGNWQYNYLDRAEGIPYFHSRHWTNLFCPSASLKTSLCWKYDQLPSHLASLWKSHFLIAAINLKPFSVCECLNFKNWLSIDLMKQTYSCLYFLEIDMFLIVWYYLYSLKKL